MCAIVQEVHRNIHVSLSPFKTPQYMQWEREEGEERGREEGRGRGEGRGGERGRGRRKEKEVG